MPPYSDLHLISCIIEQISLSTIFDQKWEISGAIPAILDIYPYSWWMISSILPVSLNFILVLNRLCWRRGYCWLILLWASTKSTKDTSIDRITKMNTMLMTNIIVEFTITEITSFVGFSVSSGFKFGFNSFIVSSGDSKLDLLIK